MGRKARGDRLREVADLDQVEAGISPGGLATGRDDGPGEAPPRRLLEAAIELGHPAYLARQPQLADDDRPPRQGCVITVAGDAQGEPEVGRGLDDAKPSGPVDEYVGLLAREAADLLEE